jgi:hypothetical protein
MGGVDVFDQKMTTFMYPHKSSKWYMTIFHRLREMAMVNAYILYSSDCNQNGIHLRPPRKFRESVIDGLLEGFVRKAGRVGAPSKTERPGSMVERHVVLPQKLVNSSHC